MCCYNSKLYPPELGILHQFIKIDQKQQVYDAYNPNYIINSGNLNDMKTLQNDRRYLCNKCNAHCRDYDFNMFTQIFAVNYHQQNNGQVQQINRGAAKIFY